MNDAPLNIVCFRLANDSLSDDELDARNRAAVREIQAGGKVFVTPTVWNGRAAIRAAFDHWATGPEDIELLKEAVLRARG